MSAGADDPTAIARSVLSERRFHNPPVPRPLHGAIAWLNDRLHSLTSGVSSRLEASGAAAVGGCSRWRSSRSR